MNESLADRKKRFLEDCCGGGGMSTPPMTGGDNMYTSDANPEGPTAGYDKPLGKKKKTPVQMGKKLRREGYKPLPTDKMDAKDEEEQIKYTKERGGGDDGPWEHGGKLIDTAQSDEIRKHDADPKKYEAERRLTAMQNIRRGREKREGKKK